MYLNKSLLIQIMLYIQYGIIFILLLLQNWLIYLLLDKNIIIINLFFNYIFYKFLIDISIIRISNRIYRSIVRKYNLKNNMFDNNLFQNIIFKRNPLINGKKFIITDFLNLNTKTSIKWPNVYTSNFMNNNRPNKFVHDFEIKLDIVNRAINFPKNYCIIDCGAHIGDGVIPIAHALKYFKRNDIIIYAIDPSKYKCEFIKKIAAINKLDNIRVLNYGLAKENKFYSTYRCENSSGNMIWKNTKNLKYSEKQFFVKLDYLTENNFIKENIGAIHLDVEGMEYDVLIGGTETINKFKPYLSLEKWNCKNNYFIKYLPNDYKFIKRLKNNFIYSNTNDKTLSPIKKLSFYVLTYNSEKHIYNVLNSIKNIVNEIIVVDSGSTDNTKNICKEFTDKIYYHDFKDGCTKSRKYAESLCNYNWILYLDSDEIPTKELINEIIEIKKGLDQNKYHAISFYWKHILWFENRPHYFVPKRKVIRMYNKLKCTYTDHPFWDLPKVNKKNVLQTNNYYNHFSLHSLDHYWYKMIVRNFDKWVIDKNKKLPVCILFIRLIFEFPLAFLKAYFLKRLFIYGFTGIFMSFIYAYSRFLQIYYTLIKL